MKRLPLIRNTVIAALLLFLATNAFAQNDYYNLIPIPPLIEPIGDTIRLEMRVKRHKFDPGNPSNEKFNGTIFQPFGLNTFAYNQAGSADMTVLGPTLHWQKDKQINLQVTNHIGDTTTTHWHGLQLPSIMDGGPHQKILKGKTWKPYFEVHDGPATMWYHPHLHNKTWPQVQAGLAGMIIIDDPFDIITSVLPRTYGVDDIPVIIGDMETSYDEDYDEYSVALGMVKRPTNVVNGVINPYVEVPAHLVRLRILNGSSRKAMVFGFSKSMGQDTSLANLEDFVLIATDGGYTLKPDTMKILTNSSGERNEILLNLEGIPIGSKLYLRNLKHLLPGGVVGSPFSAPFPPNNNPSSGKGADATKGYAFLELRVVADPPGYNPVTQFTPFLTEWQPRLQDTSSSTIARTRLKELVMHYDSTIITLQNGQDSIKYNKVGFTFDSTSFNGTRIDDTVCVNTKEIWVIDNISPVAHPFHIHKVQFRTLDIFDKATGTYLDLEALGLNGPKDDVLIMPNWTARFLAAFDLYPDSVIHYSHTYMYHCHILPHEDDIGGGMMHQFIVTNQADCAEQVGVNEENTPPSMLLFPNPTDGMLYLQGYATQSSTVNVFNIQGRLMRAQQIPAFEGDVALDIDGLPTGLYLVEWRTHKGSVTRKVVVQR